MIVSRLTPVRPGNHTRFGFASAVLLVALSVAACGADEETLASEPPVVSFELDTTEDPLVRLDARGSTDPDGFIVTWLYEYGDGSPIEYSASPQAIHVYEVNGVYTVAVTATDNSGTRSTTTATVTVRNATGPVPPVDDADAGIADAATGDATDAGAVDGSTGGGGADSGSTDLDGGTPDNGSGSGVPFPGEDAGSAPDSFGGADAGEDFQPDSSAP